MAVLVCGLVFPGCRRASAPAPASSAPAQPQVSGTIAVAGLDAPVRIVRDRHAVPHIYATTESDLFFAQGFVQAQDRLFQIDLWRRASLGRLSEILGSNFVDRDAMTRRAQYRGDMDAEWASYGPDAKTIAEAFVRGVNAWVSIARERPPEEFALAKWPPSYWFPEDLLNRTDAILESRGALESIARAHLPDAVRDGVRLIGTAPFFVGTSPPAALSATRSPGAVSVAGSSIAISESRPRLTAPSARYLVHLVGPGWNVVGATAPWLPGVAVGHNDRVAWGTMPADVETADVVVERQDRVSIGAKEYIRIKARPELLPFTRDTTSQGVVVAWDKEHGRAFVLRWSGWQPGGAGGLGALAIDRARTAGEFRAALSHWKLPARTFVYVDVEGRRGSFEPPGAKPFADPNRTGVSPAAVDPRALFAHVLDVMPNGRARFDVGPLARPEDDAPLRMTMDVQAWDGMRAVAAPGQSGVPASGHYRDGAERWARGEAFDVPFSEEAVRASADATLVLTPRRSR